MQEYHKINSLFKRHRDGEHKGKFTEEWAHDAFEYLAKSQWTWDEKIDGTNIRIMWDGENLKFGGRTERAQIQVTLYDKLNELFPKEKFMDKSAMILYGEGFGVKIQKGGGNYIPDAVSFCLFDVLINSFWLTRGSVVEVAREFQIQVAPQIGVGNLYEAIDFVKAGFDSKWGDFKFKAEGIVMRPVVQLFDRQGKRILSKLKTNDF